MDVNNTLLEKKMKWLSIRFELLSFKIVKGRDQMLGRKWKGFLTDKRKNFSLGYNKMLSSRRQQAHGSKSFQIEVFHTEFIDFYMFQLLVRFAFFSFLFQNYKIRYFLYIDRV